LVGLLLPCNVLIRALDDDTTVVEALDPKVMVSLTQNGFLSSVADEVGQRLAAARDALTPTTADNAAASLGPVKTAKEPRWCN